MHVSRCGVPDVLDDKLVDDLEILDVDDNKTLDVGEMEENKTASYFPTRRKRYALQGSRWRTKSLTYKVGKCEIACECPIQGYNRNLAQECFPALNGGKVTK